MHSHQNKLFHHHGHGHFIKLFPELEPLEAEDEPLAELAHKMKVWSNDGHTCSEQIPNGFSIFGQFLAHDITLDTRDDLQEPTEVGRLRNDRSIGLDLDSVYGKKTETYLYDQDPSGKHKLLLGKKFEKDGKTWHDLLRNKQYTAIIPDPRNDENIVVSRMQVFFIRLHNRMVDYLKEQHYRGNIFHEAKRLVIWCYHWIIAEEYLRKMLDPHIYYRIRQHGGRYYRRPWAVPVEFSGAAFRVGHSQVTDLTKINDEVEMGLFDMGAFDEMEHYVDWRYFFDFGDGKCQFANHIDTRIPKAFHDIPFIQSDDPKARSLAFRNLKRGVLYGLPSGEAVAHRMGFKPIPIPETKELGLTGTPLWYYILKEAEMIADGDHLGPVGSTIFGECFWTILKHDNQSYLKLHPKWQPFIGDGKMGFKELIEFALDQY